MAAINTDPRLMVDVVDGVHLGLPPTTYFFQDALGSSDLVKLFRQRHGWWWGSRHNPDRVEVRSEALNYGDALHVIVLESVFEYEVRFAVLPEKPPGAVETVSQMTDTLKQRGFRVDGRGAGTSGWKKDDWAKAMRDNLPDVPCWPNIVADFEASLVIRNADGEAVGQRPTVTAVEDRMLRLMRRIAEQSELGPILYSPEYPPLAEVSVFKTLPDGTRRRWRFDRLFPGLTLDLKNLGNWTGRPLPWAVGESIARFSYEIQRADYEEGRAALYEFVRDGFQVHGGSIAERDWLRRMVEATEGQNADWAWLFYQRPDPKGRAPVLFPVWDFPDSQLYRLGRERADKALAFYRQMRDDVGFDTPWSYVEQTHYTDEEFARSAKRPRVFFPHWLGEAETSEADAYTGDDQ